MNVRSWLVHLYPSAWRRRYGEEFDALLEECLHSPLDVLDILLGALDAHLQLVNGLNWRMMNMINKLRTTTWLVFAGYIGFVIGGLSLFGLVDDSPAVPLIRSNQSLHTAWAAIQIGSLISLLAVVLGGLPLALTFLKHSLTSSRRDLRLLLVPAGALLIFLFYMAFMGSIASGWVHISGVAQKVTPDNFPTGNKLLLGGLMLVFVLGALASVWAVWKILNNTEEDSTISILGRNTTVRLYSFAYLPAAITVLCMFVMLAGTIIFGSLAYSLVPGWFSENLGLLLTNTTLSFGVTLTIMVVSTALAILGLVRGYSEWKRAGQQSTSLN